MRYAARVKLRCPNEDEPGHEAAPDYDLLIRPIARGTAFRCTDCGVAFWMTTAQARRMLVRRATL
jgi:hypothetical protein